MNKSKDPFEIVFEEQEESPPDSPVGLDENEAQTSLGHIRGDVDASANVHTSQPSTSSAVIVAIGTVGPVSKPKEDDDDEEEENMDVELGKLQYSGDPDKVAKMQTLLAKSTDEQISRHESFRISGF
ncbi:transcription initiation factor TFIID subunit 11b-like [Primulina tabacum]|uniref:transcription initiation factor TFIID subunit 11b-like n=1 Tax=Primulina tabacum TaxID=48773 RepID=UPI003F59CC3C